MACKDSVELLIWGAKLTEVLKMLKGWIQKDKNEKKRANMEQEKKYGQFVKEMPESDTKKTWEWLRKAELKIQTESLLCVAQEHAFRINDAEHHIGRVNYAQSPPCRMCEEKVETLHHVVCESKKLAQRL